MSSAHDEQLAVLLATMKRAAAALEDAGVPVLLAGGLAAWARGGPPTDHDVDFYVRETDTARALAALGGAGMRVENPPEGWLVKAYDGDVLVDLIFHPSGQVVGDEMFARGEWLEVAAFPVLVASIDDVVSTKLLALTEQAPDYGAVLAIVRALREQIDWGRVWRQTESSPFARAFFTLAEGLEIVPARRARPRLTTLWSALRRPDSAVRPRGRTTLPDEERPVGVPAEERGDAGLSPRATA
jgi:hypothetical protein